MLEEAGGEEEVCIAIYRWCAVNFSLGQYDESRRQILVEYDRGPQRWMVMVVFRFRLGGGWLVGNAARHARFSSFYESTEVKKVVSSMNRYANRKQGGYRNEGSLCDAFILFRDNVECFFSLFLRVPNGPTGQVSEARPDGQSKLMSVTKPSQ